MIFSLLFLSGFNTNISQKTVIAMYNILHNGVLKYHNVHLRNIEVNNKRFVPPPKVRRNERNIVNLEYSILEVFKQTDTTQINSSSYAAMRGSFSKYYSIFGDGIQKFIMKLNGVMVRTLSENFEVTNISLSINQDPWGFNECIKTL